MRPRVAFVATVFRHLVAFHIPYMEMLIEWGYDVHTFAKFDGSESEIQNSAITCHDIDFSRNPFKVTNISAGVKLFRDFRALRIEMVHAHTPVAGVYGRLAARFAHVPSVLYTAHGFHFYEGAPVRNWVTYYPVESIMARFTDYLITINKQDYLRAKNFKVRKDTFLIPGVGVSQDVSNPEEPRPVTRRKLGIDEDEFVVLCVAELNSNKNQIQLLESARLLKKRNYKFKILLAGTGESKDQLQGKVLDYGLSDYVKFLGFRSDIPSLLQACDCVTLLSKREGLPKALMEALMAGKPIICTDVRGSRDIVSNHQVGLVVRVGDVSATVNAFKTLMDNVNLREEFGMAARNAAQFYSLEQVASEYSAIYRRALGFDSLIR